MQLVRVMLGSAVEILNVHVSSAAAQLCRADAFVLG